MTIYFIQIDFLNSVIVDMQRKNDELKAKMELYEAAGIVDTADAADMVRLDIVEVGVLLRSLV